MLWEIIRQALDTMRLHRRWAALTMFGLPAGPVRLPLVDATPEQRAGLRADLERGGVAVPAENPVEGSA